MFKLIEKVVDAVKLIIDPYDDWYFNEEAWDSDEDEYENEDE